MSGRLLNDPQINMNTADIRGLWRSFDGKILINITEIQANIWYWDVQFQLLKKEPAIEYPLTGKMFKGVIPRREGQAIRIPVQFLTTRTTDPESRYTATVYPSAGCSEFYSNRFFGEPWRES